jgi:undecaprenyl-diphosphatase
MMAGLLSINGALFDLVNDDLAGRFTPLDDAMKIAAKYAIYAIVVLLVASWFVRAGDGEHRRIAVYSGIASAGLALIVALVIQHFYTHPRPFCPLGAPSRSDVVQLISHACDTSFPSEHATAAFAIAAGAGIYRPRLGIILLVLAVLTAFSRVYVGIHYPADVASGAAIGVVAALAVWLVRPVFAYLDDLIVVRLVPEFLR